MEFMPGKEVGLSAACFPDILAGIVPNIYVYHVTNSSEMSIAKRRGYAYTITHLSPPYTRSGLYGELLELQELVHEYNEALLTDPERAKVVEKLALEKAEKLGISASSVEEIHERLFELEREIIPRGLHVLGEKWGPREAAQYLTLLLRYDSEAPSLHRLLAEARGLDYYWLLDNPSARVGGNTAAELLNEIEATVEHFVTLVLEGRKRDAVSLAASKGLSRNEAQKLADYVEKVWGRIRSCGELGAVLRALDGGYLEPRVAGDPLRTPEALPTGSHGYAFDPRLIPSQAAYMRGRLVARESLEEYRRKHGRYPETVAVVLWGFETAGTRGETIGQILEYLGVRLERRGPWSWNLTPIPVEELGHPRIDVVVTICGIFRDMFPHLLGLLDKAFKLVARLEESPEANYVRKHVSALAAEGYSRDEVLARVFGPKPGAYNTRLPETIETSMWNSEKELAALYVEDMGYAYTGGSEARPLHDVFKKLLSSTEMVTQIRYAHEYDVVDLDHYYEFLGGLSKAVEETSGKRPEVLWVDTTKEKPKLKHLRRAITDALHTRILNPKWIDAMLHHGYDGARELAERVQYLLGLAATTGEVPSWAWRRIYEKYIEDEETRERIAAANPDALHEIARRLLEAARRGYWEPSREEAEKIEEAMASRG